METKTHWKKVFNKDYLGACDLEDGNDLKAVIKTVELREIKGTQGKKEKRNVAIFTDAKIKPMVLNVTNCKIIKKFTNTPFIEDWKNVPVQIYVKGNIEAFGDITEGLRFREFQPAIEKPKLIEGSQGWNDAVAYLKKNGATMAQVKNKYDVAPEIEEKLKAAVL